MQAVCPSRAVEVRSYEYHQCFWRRGSRGCEKPVLKCRSLLLVTTAAFMVASTACRLTDACEIQAARIWTGWRAVVELHLLAAGL